MNRLLKKARAWDTALICRYEMKTKGLDWRERLLFSCRRRAALLIKAWRGHVTRLQKDFLFFCLYPAVFRFFCLWQVRETQVLLVNDHYDRLPDNLRVIGAEFQQRGFTCISCLKPKGSRLRLVARLRRQLAALRFQKYYARSKYIFFTEYYWPAYANSPRRGTQVIQLWHACGAFKKWGYSSADTKWGQSLESYLRYRTHSTYTSVMVSASKIIPCYAQAFRRPEEIIRPLGSPRTDIYFDRAFVEGARAGVLEKFPEIRERKILLYAPTFRGNSLKKSYALNPLDFMLMKRLLGEEYALVAKYHPLTAKKVKLLPVERELYGDFVFDGSGSLAIEEALCAADLVITDYSSLIFEYALLERPMIFFAYDLEQYDRDRSFYYDYREMVPGPIVRDTLELIQAVGEVAKGSTLPAIRRFREAFMEACDGRSTKRIVDFVVEQGRGEA